MWSWSDIKQKLWANVPDTIKNNFVNPDADDKFLDAEEEARKYRFPKTELNIDGQVAHPRGLHEMQHFKGIYKNELTIDDDAALRKKTSYAGLSTRHDVYENRGGVKTSVDPDNTDKTPDDFVKTRKTQSNIFRDRQVTYDTFGEDGTSENPVKKVSNRALKGAVKYDYDEDEDGKRTTKKLKVLGYSKTVSDEDQDKNHVRDVRLGKVYHRQHQIDEDGNKVQTGYRNFLSSGSTVKVADNITKTKDKTLGGLQSKTFETKTTTNVDVEQKETRIATASRNLLYRMKVSDATAETPTKVTKTYGKLFKQVSEIDANPANEFKTVTKSYFGIYKTTSKSVPMDENDRQIRKFKIEAIAENRLKTENDLKALKDGLKREGRETPGTFKELKPAKALPDGWLDNAEKALGGRSQVKALDTLQQAKTAKSPVATAAAKGPASVLNAANITALQSQIESKSTPTRQGMPTVNPQIAERAVSTGRGR